MIIHDNDIQCKLTLDVAKSFNETEFESYEGQSIATCSRVESERRSSSEWNEAKLPHLHFFEEPFVINIKTEEDN